jgi:hypothetical protein
MSRKDLLPVLPKLLNRKIGKSKIRFNRGWLFFLQIIEIKQANTSIKFYGLHEARLNQIQKIRLQDFPNGEFLRINRINRKNNSIDYRVFPKNRVAGVE